MNILLFQATLEHTAQIINIATLTQTHVGSGKAPGCTSQSVVRTGHWVAPHIRVNVNSVDVLRQPPETLAVALSFQHTTHEQLQRPRR